MIITAIIAHMPITEDLLRTTQLCVEGFRPMVDKLILIQNGTVDTVGDADDYLLSQIDHYLVNRYNRLHGGAINQGVALARPGEYLAIINDDIYPGELTREGLESLCHPGEIWSPQIAEQSHSYGAHASFFVVDYETFNRVGWWDISKGHIADVDWFDRAVALGIPMKQISTKVIHDHPAATISRVEPPKFEAGEY
jgi:hypothetical protein